MELKMVSRGAMQSDNMGSRPVPDPTVLTTQQLNREVLSLKELIESRFTSYDKAITLLQAHADRLQSIGVIEERVRSLSSLYDEKFQSVAQQFTERDTRQVQSSEVSQIAINAAFSSAKEGVEKQNLNTAKQIDLMTATFAEANKGINGKIDDIKDRLTTIEQRGSGRHEAFSGLGSTIGIVGATIVAIIAMVAFFMKV